MEAKVRLEEMKTARKTHPDKLTSGIDELVLIQIDEIINKEIKNYNIKNKEILNHKKELSVLSNKEDEISKKQIEEIKKSIELKHKEVLEQEKSIKSGDTSKKIIDQLRTIEVKNPENQIRENLQLAGYKGSELDKITPMQANTIIQKMIEKKFKSNKIRNKFLKKK